MCLLVVGEMALRSGCPMKEGSKFCRGIHWCWAVLGLVVGFALVVEGQMDPFLFVLLF